METSSLISFLQFLSVDLDEIWCASVTCWSLMHTLISPALALFKRENSAEVNMFEIGLRLDTYEPISVKLGMLIYMTKVYISILV